MNENRPKVIVDLVYKIQDVVSFLKENNISVELATELINSLYTNPDSDKAVITEDEPEEKKEVSVSEARVIAEKEGKGYSYFDKWYTNKRALQSDLHLYGKDIKESIEDLVKQGYTIKDAIEEYMSKEVFGNMEITIFGKKVNMDAFCRINNIPMGLIRANMLENKSSYKEELLKYIMSRAISPMYPVDGAIYSLNATSTLPYVNFQIAEKTPKSTVDTKVDEPKPISYDGKEYNTAEEFFNHFNFTFSKQKLISGIAKDKGVDIGEAANIWLEEVFSRTKDVTVSGVKHDTLLDVLKIHNIPLCEFWLFCKDTGYKTIDSKKEAIVDYLESHKDEFVDKKSVYDELGKPCTYNGKKYASGMDLFKEYNVGISYGIGAMRERGLSPAEVIAYHTDEDKFISPKTKKPYVPTGEQRIIEQSYLKIRKNRCKKVTYQGKEYPSILAALDDIGMTDEYKNIHYRIKKKNMSFEAAVDDVLVNKKPDKRSNKDKSFTYAHTTYKNLNEACKCYDVRPSKVMAYASNYGVNLETAFGIIVGDLKEKDCGIKKKRMYHENVWS
jgi:hypothetical protein